MGASLAADPGRPDAIAGHGAGSPATEVCSLARGMMLQPLSTRLPHGLRFFLRPVPAGASQSLTWLLPRWGTPTGLPRSACLPAWGRSRLSADGAPSATGEFGAPAPAHIPFGPSVSSTLRLL